MLNSKTTLIVFLNHCCGLVCCCVEPAPVPILKPAGPQTVIIEDGKPGFVVIGEKPPDTEAVDIAKMTPILEKVELALKAVQSRCARDIKLKPLSEVSIASGRYRGPGDTCKGAWTHIIAPTDEAFELPTKGAPLKFKGQFDVDVQYANGPTNSQPDSALHHGRVTWKTDDPHLLVALTWTSRDPKNAERLSKIVNEELQSQGIHMLPAQKSTWPAATPAERLAQLPIPDAKIPPAEKPAATTQQPSDQKPPAATPKAVAPSADGAGKIFATPEEVAAVYRRAYATKDWQTCFNVCRRRHGAKPCKRSILSPL